jgi:hypothetical protein
MTRSGRVHLRLAALATARVFSSEPQAESWLRVTWDPDVLAALLTRQAVRRWGNWW